MKMSTTLPKGDCQSEVKSGNDSVDQSYQSDNVPEVEISFEQLTSGGLRLVWLCIRPPFITTTVHHTKSCFISEQTAYILLDDVSLREYRQNSAKNRKKKRPDAEIYRPGSRSGGKAVAKDYNRTDLSSGDKKLNHDDATLHESPMAAADAVQKGRKKKPEVPVYIPPRRDEPSKKSSDEKPVKDTSSHSSM